MKLAWILLWVIATTAPGAMQEKSLIGDFTKSPTEHIINRVEPPFVVRTVKGIVVEKGGWQESLPGVLFEIQGPDTGRKIRTGTTDQRGRFRLGHVPLSTYEFKATLNGFQSVMGSIIVSKKARKTDEIKVEMRIGV